MTQRPLIVKNMQTTEYQLITNAVLQILLAPVKRLKARWECC